MERKGNEIKKVVMTGGSGPIGLALIQKLLEEHVEVFLFQREYSFRSAFVPEHEHLHIEHYTLEQLKDYEPEENDYDVFFHLGWANTGKTVRNNIEEQSKNVRYSSYAVEAAHILAWEARQNMDGKRNRLPEICFVNRKVLTGL